jgi:hypothetical protein
MSTYNTNQRPNLVTAIAVMTLISGIVNIFWGLVASMTVLATIVGVVCTPLTVLPTILGIFEIIYAAKLLGNPPQPVRPSNNIAIFEIACILAGNAFSMIVGILALVFYNDLIVKAYFAELNGMQAPIAPSAPVLPRVEPEPAESMPAPAESAPSEEPAPAEPAQPSEPPVEPTEPDKPAKPRGPRKVA